MDSARMLREAIEQRARRGRNTGIQHEVVAAYQPASGYVPGGHLDNGRVLDISRQTITGLWPPGGSMDGMVT